MPRPCERLFDAYLSESVAHAATFINGSTANGMSTR